MTQWRTIGRHDARYVKIAHVSDLHFSPKTAFPGEESPEGHLQGLAEDLALERPDLLCVTGDVLDSALIDALRSSFDRVVSKVTRSRVRSWKELCRETFGRARSFFEHLCSGAGIDPAAGLFVIPGNHDYRVQGFNAQDPDLIETFNDVFGPYFRGARLVLPAEDDDDGPPIAVTVAVLDSNADAAPLALATGALTEKEFRRFAIFAAPPDAAASASGGSSFRVCLLHHHPLPVVAAETFREAAADPGLRENIDAWYRVATGPQTSLLKNAGAFLWAAAEHSVDLVLHGHEHHAWVSELRYPRARHTHRLLVAAAASAGSEAAGAFGYNVATLDVDGRVVITQKVLERNLRRYEVLRSYPDYSDSDLRSLRYEKAVAALREEGRRAAALVVGGPRPGGLRAARIAQVNRLGADGNVRITRRFEDLEAMDGSIRVLPLTVLSPGYTGLGSIPRVRRLDRQPSRITPHVDTQANPQAMQVQLEFDPPLQPGSPVSFEVSYQLCNAFHFVEEYRRARPPVAADKDPMDGCELVSTKSRMIIARRASQTVVFPAHWSPPEPPQVRVYDSSGRTDRIEQAYGERSLQYIEGERLATLAVDLPLPNTTYEISWRLRPRARHDQVAYGELVNARVRRLEALKWTETRAAAAQALLENFRTLFRSRLPGQDIALVDDATEISLFLADARSVGTPERPATSVLLVRRAYLPLPSGLDYFREDIPAGVGIVGQAFRSERVVVDTSEGRSGFYKMLPGQQQPHRLLGAIPIPVPMASGPGRPHVAKQRRPSYAVLCLGTFEAGTGLEQLEESSELGDAVTACLVDWVVGHFNAELFESLTGVRDPVTLPSSPGARLTLSHRLQPPENVRTARVSGSPASADPSATLDAVWALYHGGR